MIKGRQQILEWESRWTMPAGVATLFGAVLLIASAFVIGSVSGDTDSALLRSAHEHASAVTLASVLEALGFVLLVAPLVFLFRAADGRSEQMRSQLIGLVVAAPLFLAASGLLNATATNEAADSFSSGGAKSTLTPKEAASECGSDLKEKGAKEFGEEHEAAKGSTPQARCVAEKRSDDEASNALSEASTRGIATGFGLAGRLGLAIALFYTCLNAMRVGLLSRFWGSLGMALGVAALLLLVQFSLIFFIYLGLLLIGRIPGGRPPAWPAGRAVPWPTAGEKAAAALEPSEPTADDEPEPPPDGPRRKRKRRD